MPWFPTTTAERLRSLDRVILNGHTGDVDLLTNVGSTSVLRVRLRVDDELRDITVARDKVLVLGEGSTERHRGVEYDSGGNHGYPYRAYCNTCDWRSVGYVRWHAANGMAEHHGCDGTDARDELARFAQLTRDTREGMNNE